ncbi:hypothetical protein ACSDR0_18485 [Streptosporangium sp. G11]|uniref:hypothetical protein n=1 Tax=Streptosporangium sp. G11 TaxID=3436926 RepID=UPI003EB7FCF8
MPRRPTPLDPQSGPLAAFALELRHLRDQAGGRALSIDQISDREKIARSTLFAVMRGARLPNRDVLAALVAAWGGDQGEWMSRRSAVETQLELQRRALSHKSKWISQEHRLAYVKPMAIHLGRVGDSHVSQTAGIRAAYHSEMATFTQALNNLREEAGRPSHRQMAKQMQEVSPEGSVSYSTLNNLFTGRAAPPHQAVLRTLIAVLAPEHERDQLFETLESHRLTLETLRAYLVGSDDDSADPAAGSSPPS